MRSAIHDLFRVLLLILIPLASFTTGLQAPPPGAKRLWRRPKELIRGLVAVMVVVPLWVLALVQVMPLSLAVRAGMLIAVLAVGIGPVAGMKRMAGNSPHASDALDLNLAVLVLSIVFVPLAFGVFAALLGRDLHLGYWPVAKVVLGRALIPLLIGIGVARSSPAFAAKTGPRLAKIVDGGLLAVLAIAIAATWREMASVGGLGWIACVLASVGAVILGHVVGGPEPETRAVDAVAATMRFPALALTLAAAVPQGKRLVPVVAVYIVASLLVVTAYGLVMRRRERRRPRPVTSARPQAAHAGP
jgi:bile acid:Na+ symporter, BASS family